MIGVRSLLSDDLSLDQKHFIQQNMIYITLWHRY